MFDEKYLNFHFPLFTTCLHMLVQFCLATTVLYFIPRLRPRSDSITNPQNHFHVRRDMAQDEKPLMTRIFYLTRIGPCGAATGLDIGLGNMSLKFITLTFYSMSSLDLQTHAVYANLPCQQCANPPLSPSSSCSPSSSASNPHP